MSTAPEQVTLNGQVLCLGVWSPWILAGIHDGTRYQWRWMVERCAFGGQPNVACYRYEIKVNESHDGGGSGALYTGEDPYERCRQGATGHWWWLPFAQQPVQLGLGL